MRTVNFKDFTKDYTEYYKKENRYLMISTYSEMLEIINDLYSTDDFERDYEHEIIELY